MAEAESDIEVLKEFSGRPVVFEMSADEADVFEMSVGEEAG